MRRFGEINIYEILSSKDAAEPIGPTLFAGPYMAQGRLIIFFLNFENSQKHLWYCFLLYEEKMLYR